MYKYVLFICLFCVGCVGTTVTYLPSDEKLYRVPKSSFIDRGSDIIETPWDGYLMSDGQLMRLYRAAKEEAIINEID